MGVASSQLVAASAASRALPEAALANPKSTVSRVWCPEPWGGPSCTLELIIGSPHVFKPDEVVKSALRQHAGSHWELCVYPQGHAEGKSTHVSIFLVLISPDDLLAKDIVFEVVNWLPEGQPKQIKVGDRTFSRPPAARGRPKALELSCLSQQTGLLGPGGSLWVRAHFSLSRTGLYEAPALSEEEVEVLVPTAAGMGSRRQTTSRIIQHGDFKWRLSVADLQPSNDNESSIMGSVEAFKPDGADMGWQPPSQAKYTATLVNWYSWERSAQVSGTVSFSAASLMANIKVPLPPGVSRSLGWLGPSDALWIRASLQPTSIRHSFHFMPRDVVLGLETLVSMQVLQGKGHLVKRTIDLSRSTVGIYSKEYCVVSHYWHALAQPDPKGLQLAALKQHLLKNRDIQFVWFDFCCLPQRNSSTHTRNMIEEREFRDGLEHVYLLFLNVGVLILSDLNFHNRFWPLWEAWLAMHTPSASGLQLAAQRPQQRWTVIDMQADSQTPGDNWYLTTWVSKYPSEDEVFTYLRRDDVKVTNKSDKQVQLEILRNISESVKSAFK